MRLEDDLTCAELVELVTEYLDQGLPLRDAERLEEHLVFCGGCIAHVDQMRETIRLTGSLRTEGIEPAVARRLRVAFEDWRDR